MAVWLCPAGRHGEYDYSFLKDSRIYCTIPHTDFDLEGAKKAQMKNILNECNHNAAIQTISNWMGELVIISEKMSIGDYVFLPSKKGKVFYVAKICDEYQYREGKLPSPHYRVVKWFSQKIPRNAFEQDILYSLGAYRTICKDKQEELILKVLKNCDCEAVI